MNHPDQYGLIGYPLGHSSSKVYFNEKFAAEQIPARYELYPLENIKQLPKLVDELPQLKGLNVTLPYKVEVLPLLSETSYEAKQVGAVNTIKIERSKGLFRKRYLLGYNTDVIGFRTAIKPLIAPHQRKALILGSGGASLAVKRAFKTMNIASMTVTRTPSQPQQICYEELTKEVLEAHTIVVNATPLGMSGEHINEFPPIPYEYLSREHLCYDLVYNPPKTIFLNKSEQYGAQIQNGLDMLFFQAEASWKIWTDKEFTR